MQGFKKWIENFWYHYKWHTIVGGFFLLMLTLLLVQCIGREQKDFQILYTGPIDMQKINYSEIEDALGEVKGDEVALHFLWLYTDEQLEQVITSASTSAIMASNRESFYTWTQTGENIVYLLDPTWYQSLKENGLLAPFCETLGYTPDGAIDEYGIRFHDTAFAKQYAAAFAALPDDTVLCMRAKPIHSFARGKKKAEERYEENRKFFVDLLKYGEE